MKTEVIFRKEKSGDYKGTIYALFPYEVETYRGDVLYYQHIGQHSAADYFHCIRTSVPAKPGEYADLKRELEGIGYDLKIIKRRNYDKYLQEYKKQH